MASEKMREEFEAAVIAEFKTVGVDSPDLCRGSNGDYLNNVVGGAWWAWQASRESLVIELPQQSGANISWNQAIRYCHEALEAAGLKVKS